MRADPPRGRRPIQPTAHRLDARFPGKSAAPCRHERCPAAARGLRGRYGGESWSPSFAAYGYERVKPPLVEFEETLLAGSGAALADQTFKLVDPLSQRTLALRADMTMQIARIATTRLANRPRPLRLSYAGQVVRVVGSELRAERQFGQVGAELVGVHCARADVEIITMAAEALAQRGARAAFGRSWPADTGLVPCSRWCVQRRGGRRLRMALDCKDAGAVAAMADDIGRRRPACWPVSSPPPALPKRRSLRWRAASLPAKAPSERAALVDVFARIAALRRGWTSASTWSSTEGSSTTPASPSPSMPRTSAVSWRVAGATWPARRAGDRDNADHGHGAREPAAARPRRRRVYVPLGVSAEQAVRLRAEGWVTVHAVDYADDLDAEAARLRCDARRRRGAVRAVDLRKVQARAQRERT